MKKIGFVGLPGTGKSSQAECLIDSLNTCNIHTETTTEFARTFIEKYGIINNLKDQLIILDGQIALEDDILSNGDTKIMVTDSPIHLVLFYSTFLSKENEGNTLNLIANRILKHKYKYDIIFYCPDNLINEIDDGIRAKIFLDPEWRKEWDKHLRFIFKMFKPKQLIELKSMSIEDRNKECLEHIKKLDGDLFNG